ncbi:MAG: membrane protein [Saprospiraceae bacterium]|nr:MAG: membrane protein [Saprospiraceae bacterium]
MVSEMQIENKANAQSSKAIKTFNLATRILFTIAVIGQWLFVYYIVAFYGGVVVSGAYEKINKVLVHGMIEGDNMGNFVLGVHIFLAAIITFGGPIQFFSTIRNRFPVFHRWNGRIYFVTAFLISSAGLFMIATRGAVGGTIGMLGNILNAILIMTFAVFAWRAAMQRNFKAHKKWAIRTFLMVSGVWFIRIGYCLWILLTGFTAPGTNKSMSGPFDNFLGLGHSLIPLLILELYFFAKAHPSLKIKKIATVVLLLLGLLLSAGVVMVVLIFWLPKLTHQ